MKVRFFILILILILTLSAAHADDSFLGKKCSGCGKAVSDKKFAAVIEEEKKTMYFDDIGCLLKFRAGTNCLATQAECDSVTSVFDFYTGEKMHIRAAYFVRSEGKIKTPDGSGLAAFKEKKSAERFIKEFAGKKILDFEDLK